MGGEADVHQLEVRLRQRGIETAVEASIYAMEAERTELTAQLEVALAREAADRAARRLGFLAKLRARRRR